MGGPGSGRRGGARDAGGRFTMEGAISITVAEAVDNVELLADQTQKLTQILDKNSGALDENSQSLDKNSNEKVENSDKTKQNINDLDVYAVNLQVATSALNQSTGALMKMTSGLEAAGVLTAEQAAQTQKYIRVLEIFTGAMELALSVTLILNFFGYSLTAAMTAAAGGVGTLTTSLVSAAAASYAFLAPWAPLIFIVTVVLAVLLLLQLELDILGKAIGMMNAGLSQMVNSLGAVLGLASGVTSAFGSLGDALMDNPMSKTLLKAGGSVF
tara:strand:- start:3958 stop:4770 length:813 start_codon:yes stop_codon:yes gene_type:complete